ncbi:MAG: sulfotransferase family 2 domain-containing protein [Arenicellales bacterium]
MLVNIHVPKNAGTTLNAVLARNFGGRFEVLNLAEEVKSQSPKPWGENLFFLPPASEATCLTVLERAREAGVAAASGHWIYPFDQTTAEAKDLLLMTFLRHPVARLLSLYHYERKWSTRRPDIYGEKHCSQRPFEEYIDLRGENATCIDNWQCYCLTGQRSGAVAIEKLRGFFFVGLVEHWNRSMILLQRAIQARGIENDFDIDYVRQHGAAATERSAVTLSAESRRRLIAHNGEDMALYEYARNRVESEWRALSGRHGALARLLAVRAIGHLRRRIGTA